MHSNKTKGKLYKGLSDKLVTRPSGLFRKDNQDDLVSEYVGLDNSFDDLKFHKIYIMWLQWLAHLDHVL